MFSKLSSVIKSLTKIERYLLIGAAVIFAVSLFFAGINGYYNATAEAPMAGGEYIEGIIGQPIAINPLLAGANDADRDLIELIFSDLLELSENYKISDDKKIWSVELKKGLAWDDGEPLTSDDVIFTIETIQDPEARSPLYATWQGVMAERLGDREIRFTLKNPYAFFADNLKSLKIVPKHIFSNIPTANLRLSNYNLKPVGNGPYKFVKYDKRDDGFITQYHLKLNQNYSGPKPFIAELIIKFFSDYKDVVNVFNKKQVSGLGGLDFNQLKDLQIGHQVLEMNIPRYYAIFFNPNINLALKEKAVREALNYATDKNKIIAAVFDGRALAINGPIIPKIPGFNPTVYQDEVFSLESAQEILESAKWNLNDAGIRIKTIKGAQVKLEFDIIVPQIQFLIETVNILKEDWQKIGVKLNPIVLTPADISNEIIKTRNYPMIIFGNILKNNPDVFAFWHSSERFYPGLNLALYENKAVDEILENIKRGFDDDARNKNLTKLQEIIKEDRPAIFLFSPNYIYAVPKDLRGLELKFIGTPANRFDEIAKWHLKTNRVFK
ncbi:MAG: hypothetical protein A2745_03225 [Candidatus Harrisonbacteria bacterium RIFCSPHIGHO2_01_FULL_44_13]|uniref:Solute-binding protein family 5 domain-containing protein n=1 Tax=Candidatus Harrisonbacteria bacterium RIFCSPLOWO2_01_FULL_44_18 TaxID=1798407 RepID=A0A1G1ZL89_9BACT|nr:MAG: hypothetical protein A2745_03225 [Candidatus Harrisonbacteria bacterium RIFCSPHIGHO2_01_FULL_44_13]OGY65403.1 MAG: hypothetical protein A3A16_03075 [Candidatus Harrisonbacteria bacterium RIFCSPLOWO2_01_FULL_44_18]